MNADLDLAIRAARAGGAILREGLDRELDVAEKDDQRSSIVTWADLRSQEEIVRIISEARPGHAIVGEEGSGGADESDHTWYVDPVDGTTNYSHGLPCYCVSIALCDAAGVAAGVVFDPWHDDLFAAARDGAATHNGTPMAVAPTATLRSSLLSTQVQSDDPAVWERYLDRVRRFLGAGRAVRSLGSPALAMAYVARGWLDCFCEEHMSPWDTLAGALLVERAGGRVTDFAGHARPVAAHADVLATNRLLHDELVALLLEPSAAPTAGGESRA